jgi:hypothetical protein
MVSLKLQTVRCTPYIDYKALFRRRFSEKAVRLSGFQIDRIKKSIK